MSNAVRSEDSIQGIITKLSASESPAVRRVVEVLVDLKGEAVRLNDADTVKAIQQSLNELRDAAHLALEQFETDTAPSNEHIRARRANGYLRCTAPTCRNYENHADASFTVSRNTNFVMDNRGNDVSIGDCRGESSHSWCNDCGAQTEWVQ